VTPMMTQLTYEGLIDELFSIRNGIVDLDPRVVGQAQQTPGQAAPPPSAPKKIKVALNSNDKLYTELRDTNFTVVGSVLKRRALALQEFEQERTGISSVSEIKTYVKKFKDMNFQQEKNLLALHTNVASEIGVVVRDGVFQRRIDCEQSLIQGREGRVSEYVEEQIYKQENFSSTMRLLCLHSLTCNGLKKYDFFRREILQSYGYDTLFTMANLERVGLCKRQEGRSQWSNVRKALNVWVDDVDETNPNDISYVYSGFAPLSVRIIQNASKPPPSGWRSLDEALRPLPGPLFEETQVPCGSAARAAEAPRGRAKVCVIYFIGGCTFTELSAIRFLAKQDQGIRDYLVCTTKITNGDGLIDSVVDKLPRGMLAGTSQQRRR